MSRSIAEQSERELGGRVSVLVRQRRDHAQLDRLLQRVLESTGAAQDEALTRVHRLVFAHAFAEETVLFPAVRRLVPDGEALTLRVERTHQGIDEAVSELDRTPSSDPRRAELVRRYVELLQADLRDEEDGMLPRLQEAADVRTQRRIGIAWEVVRRTAPTRPHPVVARRPPGNALSGLPLSVIDRSRDRLDRLARRAPHPWATRAARASTGLARLAGVVERRRVLQRGERPETKAPEAAPAHPPVGAAS